MKNFIILILAISLSSCFLEENDNNSTAKKAVITLGKTVFADNCAVCHGENAQGIYPDWKERLPNGLYPPPPLNGSAHTWHHSPELLLQVINDGGSKIGGLMPAFKDKLSVDEKQAVLEYIYSLWPQDIVDKYNQRFNTDI